VLRRLFRRDPSPDVRIPGRVLVAVAPGGEDDLLAYSPPGRGGIWFLGFTTPEGLDAYWRAREADYAVTEVETVDLFEIVAAEADGLAIDPDSEEGVFLDRRDVRRWLAAPRAAPGD